MPGKALCLEEREEIRAGIERRESAHEIARTLGRDPSTISREIKRNNGRSYYRAALAQRRCDRKRRRPKPFKLMANRKLGMEVEKGLRLGFSPAAIAALMRARDGERVAHETIYQALYSSTYRGISLMPHSCLRTRRRRRHHHNRRRRNPYRSWLTSIRSISERPHTADDRQQAGHWEGDLILGTRQSGSAVITLVERTSRRLLLVPLFGGYTASAVADGLIGAFTDIPAHLRRSLTWDQGSEMSMWRHVEDDLELPIYFCHPRSPWERGSNENTNRQIRYWLPKRTHICAHPPQFYERIAYVLNNTPRRLLGWSSAEQRYRELAAMH